MTEPQHRWWTQHLETIGDELLRLTTVCDVNLREPDVIDRILKNDATVCGRSNPIGFRKLRELLIGTFSSVNKAIDRIGPDETKLIVDAIKERLERQRALGSGAARAPATSNDEAK